MRASLLRQSEAVAEGERGKPLEDVVRQPVWDCPSEGTQPHAMEIRDHAVGQLVPTKWGETCKCTV